ncbi:urease accessory UreF family protein [Cellulosimicrobium marinum]|uniref:urease accessory UreF family protein n=1 Tax=Cellulosimicrobium marinum TaxID=1638992 RepID=UPI001E51984A|nr:urease accessory UreF family protein [Cellulosimicrobium marinum]MCB7136918.1 urease accessory protein UreF [Cellulosimicrobium marinum]
MDDGAARAAQGRAELMLALLADARLPTGGHTQSAGLEPALRAGMPAAAVPDYVRARLATVTRVEAATAVVARHAVLAAAADRAPDGAWSPVPTVAGALVATWSAWAARTPSAALRETSQRLGRGYLRLLRRLWAGEAGVVALDAAVRHVDEGDRAASDGDGRRGREGRTAPPRPVVLGVTAACAGLSAVQVARLVGYEDVQTVAAATLKLAPVDPVEATGWVLVAQPAIDALAHDVAHLTDPRAIPALGAPLVEQWAETHARTTERLFSA